MKTANPSDIVAAHDFPRVCKEIRKNWRAQWDRFRRIAADVTAGLAVSEDDAVWFATQYSANW